MRDGSERIEFERRKLCAFEANRNSPARRIVAALLALSDLARQEGRDPTLLVEDFRDDFMAGWLGVTPRDLAATIRQLSQDRLVEIMPSGALRLLDLPSLALLVAHKSRSTGSVGSVRAASEDPDWPVPSEPA